MNFRSGFIAVIGKPNAGKSTLINALLGQKIAAVSPRPQTTRRQQLGILTLENAQLTFIDTPGLHIAKHKLGESLNYSAESALENVDIVFWIVDAAREPNDEDRLISARIHKIRTPLILGLNKIDAINAETLTIRLSEYGSLAPNAKAICAFSATRGDGRADLIQSLISFLPERDPDYPEDQITDFHERDIASDLIRESALNFLRDEVPHALNVRIDEFTERGEMGAYIAATILVERESQKGIVIGEGGAMLKKIGSAARKEIEAMSGRKVFLEVRVKVLKDWRNDEDALRRFGFKVEKKKKKKK
jgi:GTP-binding protein Era